MEGFIVDCKDMNDSLMAKDLHKKLINADVRLLKNRVYDNIDITNEHNIDVRMSRGHMPSLYSMFFVVAFLVTGLTLRGAR